MVEWTVSEVQDALPGQVPHISMGDIIDYPLPDPDQIEIDLCHGRYVASRGEPDADNLAVIKSRRDGTIGHIVKPPDQNCLLPVLSLYWTLEVDNAAESDYCEHSIGAA